MSIGQWIRCFEFVAAAKARGDAIIPVPEAYYSEGGFLLDMEDDLARERVAWNALVRANMCRLMAALDKVKAREKPAP